MITTASGTGPAEWSVSIARVRFLYRPNLFRVEYDYDGTRVRLIEVRTSATSTSMPSDPVSAVFFLKRANVEADSETLAAEAAEYDEEPVPSKLSVEQDVMNLLRERVEQLAREFPNALLATFYQHSTPLGTQPYAVVIHPKYFAMYVTVDGGQYSIPPCAWFVINDVFGASLWPHIDLKKGQNTVIYGLAGAIGFGVEQPEAVVVPPEARSDERSRTYKPVVPFGAVIRAINHITKFDSGWIISRNFILWFADEASIVIGPERAFGVVKPHPLARGSSQG